MSWRKWNFKAERSGSGSRKPILHEQGKRWPKFQHDSRLTIQEIWKWLRTSGNYALHCLWIKIVLNLWKFCQNAGEEVVRLSRFCFIYFFPFLVHAGGSTYRTKISDDTTPQTQRSISTEIQQGSWFTKFKSLGFSRQSLYHHCFPLVLAMFIQCIGNIKGKCKKSILVGVYF